MGWDEPITGTLAIIVGVLFLMASVLWVWGLGQFHIEM